MTGNHEPDPNNRFETWADGRTPAGHEPPIGDPYAAEQPTWSPTDATEPQGPSSPPTTGPSFPTYPYGSSTGRYQDPHQDEAFAAYQGYQANTGAYPGQSMQPYYPYQGPYGGAPHAYGRIAPRAPYAVPALVLGIVSLFCGGVTGPIGLGLGIASLKQIQASAGRLAGRGMAIAGIVTGAFGTLTMLFWLLGTVTF